MTKILFVCHGNICRSPMAEFVMKDLVKKEGLEKDFIIESAATSTEEIGNDMHSGAKKKLSEMAVPFTKRHARRITPEDYSNYDYLIGMDVENLYYMQREWNKDPDDKVKLLLTYANRDRDIADPWYTGNFDATYEDILMGCKALLVTLTKGL
ncbi:MAG: low molecular weight phosphotyrosine protein phosphatase [Treponema sp.]|nr:low molecular weight phosphotyrosine protein phosphatase [Treponema sp.]